MSENDRTEILAQKISRDLKYTYPKLFFVVRRDDYDKLPPEKYNGHIEYKRTLTNGSGYKIEQYATQMRWRIMQNYKDNVGIYYIGVDDDGTIVGLSETDIFENIKKFVEIVKIIKGSITGIHLIIHKDNSLFLKIEVKSKLNINHQIDFDLE